MESPEDPAEKERVAIEALRHRVAIGAYTESDRDTLTYIERGWDYGCAFVLASSANTPFYRALRVHIARVGMRASFRSCWEVVEAQFAAKARQQPRPYPYDF